jgi:hypothetical protein
MKPTTMIQMMFDMRVIRLFCDGGTAGSRQAASTSHFITTCDDRKAAPAAL